jgi:hypothetical protein
MYGLKRSSLVAACTSLFAVVLLACDGKRPINPNKEGGLASAPQVNPSSNANAVANTSAKENFSAPTSSVTVKGKVVSVYTDSSEIVGSVSGGAKEVSV